MNTEIEERRKKIFERACFLFNDSATARRWMAYPIPNMNGLTPNDLASRKDGLKIAIDILTQIEHGVYN